jgi:hypothetical protein
MPSHKSLPLLRIAAAALLWSGMLRVPAQAGPLISPAASSDAVLAQTNGEQELRLQYRVERDAAPTDTITIGLAKDYHYKNSPLGLWIYDYRLRRIFRVRGNSQYTNDSLYAEAWYRRAELENRAAIASMLGNAGVDAGAKFSPQDPYWAETELGLTTPKFARPALKRMEVKERISWQLNGEEVFAIRYRHEPVPSELRSALRRLWPAMAFIHPQIADELAASGRLPAEMWVRQMVHAGKSFEVAHWTLMHDERVAKAQYPLPAGLVSVPTDSSGAYPQIFQILSTEVADRRVPPLPDEYQTRVESAARRKAGLEALTWILEMQLAAGTQDTCRPPSDSLFCKWVAEVRPLAQQDPRTALAFAKQAPDAADRPQFDALPNAYMLRLLWVTKPPGKGVKWEDSEADLLQALRASPVANFCKDGGDFYARAFHPFAAWQIYDLGRLMAGHKPNDLLSQVDTVEQQVSQGEPTLF